MPGPSPTVDDRIADPDDPVGPADLAGDDRTTEVLAVVTGMLVDVIGPEYLIGLSIDLDTAFDADLEMESLEFVALAERLLAHYGREVDFVGWLATMELDEIIALTVDDLVSFIVAATTGPAATATAGMPGTAGATATAAAR